MGEPYVPFGKTDTFLRPHISLLSNQIASEQILHRLLAPSVIDGYNRLGVSLARHDAQEMERHRVKSVHVMTIMIAENKETDHLTGASKAIIPENRF